MRRQGRVGGTGSHYDATTRTPAATGGPRARGHGGPSGGAPARAPAKPPPWPPPGDTPSAATVLKTVTCGQPNQPSHHVHHGAQLTAAPPGAARPAPARKPAAARSLAPPAQRPAGAPGGARVRGACDYACVPGGLPECRASWHGLQCGGPRVSRALGPAGTVKGCDRPVPAAPARRDPRSGPHG